MTATLQLSLARALGLRLRTGAPAGALTLRAGVPVGSLALQAAAAAALTLHSTPTASGADFDPADFDPADFKTT